MSGNSRNGSFPPGSLIYLLWNKADVYMGMRQDGNNEWLEKVMKQSKELHLRRGRHYGTMNNADRVKDLHDMIDELARDAGLIPEPRKRGRNGR